MMFTCRLCHRINNQTERSSITDLQIKAQIEGKQPKFINHNYFRPRDAQNPGASVVVVVGIPTMDDMAPVMEDKEEPAELGIMARGLGADPSMRASIGDGGNGMTSSMILLTKPMDAVL